LIYIDDMERKSKGVDIAEIIGLVSFLKEQRDCKVIIILNDDSLKDEAKEKFRLHGEKIVTVHVV
jgi:hypothetical protein